MDLRYGCALFVALMLQVALTLAAPAPDPKTKGEAPAEAAPAVAANDGKNGANGGKGPGEIGEAADAPVGAAEGAPPAAKLALPSAEDCRRAAVEMVKTIKKTQKDAKFSLVYFCGKDSGAIMRSDSRQASSEGDPIFYNYFGPSQPNMPEVTVSKCGKDAGFAQYGTTPKYADLQSDKGVWRWEVSPSTTCFDEAEISLTGKIGAESIDKTYTVSQYDRHFFTMQIGAAFTSHVEHDYAVTDSKIRATGPEGTGPQYFASAVVYGFPHHLKSLFDGATYHGRDVINEHDTADRIGLLLGVGIEAPSKLFVAGLTYEVINGINLVVANRWARYSVLDDVKEGDAFTGAAAAIPTRDKWDSQVTFGVSLDGRLLTNLIQGK